MNYNNIPNRYENRLKSNRYAANRLRSRTNTPINPFYSTTLDFERHLNELYLKDPNTTEITNIEGRIFTGKIPNSISRFAQLRRLDIPHNYLSGVIPESIRMLHNLEMIDLSFNKFLGEIDLSIFSSLRKLTKLYLVHCGTRGMKRFINISSYFNNCPKLKVLKLSNNDIKVSMSDLFGSLIRLTNLTNFILGQASNFAIGCDLVGDWENMFQFYSEDFDTLRLVGRMKIGTQTKFPNQITVL